MAGLEYRGLGFGVLHEVLGGDLTDLGIAMVEEVDELWERVCY